MEEMLERIRQLEHENELLRVKVDKNSGDCEQLWMVIRMFFKPGDKPSSLGKLKLDRRSFATIIVSLLLGASSFTFRVLQFMGWI